VVKTASGRRSKILNYPFNPKNLLLYRTSSSSRPESPPADANISIHPSSGDVAKRQRKRREMQSITKVVETRDFPYNDEYLWKNNGKSKKDMFLLWYTALGYHGD
jgi:hypothetical protein